MNIINKQPVDAIGFHFIENKYLPKGKNEYHLREKQQRRAISYRPLHESEIDTLIANLNTADDWRNIHVADGFNPKLVKHNSFFGLVRIGRLRPEFHEFHNFKMPVGIYNSTIISSDIGDDVCIDNVKYLSHYIIENDVMLANILELACTDKAKFGNGILKDGETEKKNRIVIEVCNENGGRAIIPFNGMLAGDAYLWSRYRDDELLLQKFKELTEKKFDHQRGYYGKICARTVIKNCGIIKDTWIGSDAYIKGANKLKNLTINSDAERKSQIGEGCELVNGIVGYGCRIFYGVKAVRFITAAHSQLKYGARLINSYLGNNSTISCCEVLNSMIFPAHEQHHNNSFLCAALIMGQSNIAAGATLGSNHNSRGADGELVTGRGFWPGLCVSLKHNTRLASFCIIAKGDYSYELDIPIPFALVSNDLSKDRLVVMPGYWFMYNMYALARNAYKYEQRDQRAYKFQRIEFDYLAPDTVNEMFDSLQIFKQAQINEKGEAIISGWENSKRQVVITKVGEAKKWFEEMIELYAGLRFMRFIEENKITRLNDFMKALPTRVSRTSWLNVGGQLILHKSVETLKKQIKSGKIKSWDDVHSYYQAQGNTYDTDAWHHALASYLELKKKKISEFNKTTLKELLQHTIKKSDELNKLIRSSREKDYTNPFRKMVYENDAEMNAVIGGLDENSFIQEQKQSFIHLKKQINQILVSWKL